MNVDVLLRFFLLLNSIGDFIQKFLHILEIVSEFTLTSLFVIDFGLDKMIGTMSSLRASFYFLSLSMDIFCFLMKFMVY